jgi:hypothetical protein
MMGRRLRRLLKSFLAYEYVRYLLAGKWFILSVTSLFVVGSLVYYALQREEYLSESEFIPPNLQMLPVRSGAAVIPGGADDITQIIAYLSSDQTRGKIVRLYHLVERYDIQASSPRTKAKKIEALLDRNIFITRTKAQTIRIQVYDVNPDTAYMINQFLLQEAENFCRGIAKYKDYYDNSVASFDSIKVEMASLERTLSEFRYKYKVFTLSDAQESPTQTAIQLMLNNPDALRQYDKVVSMETRMRRFQELYTRLYERVEDARVTLNTYPLLIIMVDPPFKSDFPDRPRLLRNTVLAGAIGFLLSAFLVVYVGMLGFFAEEVEEAEERDLIAEKA